MSICVHPVALRGGRRINQSVVAVSSRQQNTRCLACNQQKGRRPRNSISSNRSLSYRCRCNAGRYDCRMVSNSEMGWENDALGAWASFEATRCKNKFRAARRGQATLSPELLPAPSLAPFDWLFTDRLARCGDSQSTHVIGLLTRSRAGRLTVQERRAKKSRSFCAQKGKTSETQKTAPNLTSPLDDPDVSTPTATTRRPRFAVPSIDCTFFQRPLLTPSATMSGRKATYVFDLLPPSITTLRSPVLRCPGIPAVAVDGVNT